MIEARASRVPLPSGRTPGETEKGRPPRRCSAAWRGRAGLPENIRRTVTPKVERCHDPWGFSRCLYEVMMEYHGFIFLREERRS